MITINEDLISQTQLSEKALKQTIAVLLFERKIFSFVQARKFAEMERIEFMDLLGQNKVALNDNIEELHHDIKTLENL